MSASSVSESWLERRLLDLGEAAERDSSRFWRAPLTRAEAEQRVEVAVERREVGARAPAPSSARRCAAMSRRLSSSLPSPAAAVAEDALAATMLTLDRHARADLALDWPVEPW